MPDFLDKFVNKTLPDAWDGIKDWWSEMAEDSVDNELYVLVSIATVIICIILAIVVHNANKRDRKFIDSNIVAEVEHEAKAETPIQKNMNAVERAIARADYESIMNVEEPAEGVENTSKDVGPIEAKDEPKEVNNTQPLKDEAKSNVNPIVMEKIEIVRNGVMSEPGEDGGRMTYDTSRNGKTYTEKELLDIIK